MKWLTNILYVFALLMLAMGIHGAEKSRMSLIAGILIAVLAGVGGWYGLKKPTVGYAIGFLGALLPVVQFGRVIATQEFKVYPHVLGFVLGLVTAGCCVFGHLQNAKKTATNA